MEKEAHVSDIEVKIRTDLKAIFKRETTVGKREKAVEKREKEVEKTVAKQKKREEQLEKAQMQVKRDGESMFQRETKLWQDKKELVNEMCKFDAKVHQSRKDIKREKEGKCQECENPVVLIKFSRSRTCHLGKWGPSAASP